MIDAAQTKLSLENLGVSTSGATLVSDVSFTFERGQFVVLLGPNGAGKTTLLRAALGLLDPTVGSANLNGVSTNSLSPLNRARAIAYLPQMRPLAWPAQVRDIVSLGRFAHGAALGRLDREDAAAVDRALTDCNLQLLSERRADTLSGGELARVHCARAFAAQTPLLIADEPVAALDPRHQHQVMGLIRSFVDGGGGALCVLHDIALAAKYADRLLWMKDGKLIADGPPEETITSKRLMNIYGVAARLNKNEIGGIDVQIDGPA
jgi:iron complex transport system ATP-binding protein